MTKSKLMKRVTEEFEIQDFKILKQKGNKIFAVKTDTYKNLQKNIDDMIELLNKLTIEDQLNGKKPLNVQYAFLNEQSKTAEGFSFKF